MKNLIITESSRMLGEKEKEILGSRCVSFTFLPYFKQVKDVKVENIDDVFIQVSNPRALSIDNISKYELSKMYEREFQKNIVSLLLNVYDGGEIFLAQDNDAGGNLMASLLKYKLMSAGVPEKKIKRIIGVEFTKRNGIHYLDIYGGSFYPETLLIRVLERYRCESESIIQYGKIDKRLRKGYRNIIALKETLNNIYFPEEIFCLSKGIGLATYLVNGALDEHNK